MISTDTSSPTPLGLETACVHSSGSLCDIVMCVDDLDRCKDGKSVKTLEAVQLLFNETAPPTSSGAGLFTKHGGWQVFCAMATCCWLRAKARLSAWSRRGGMWAALLQAAMRGWKKTVPTTARLRAVAAPTR